MTRGTLAAALLAAATLAGCSGGGDEPAAHSTPVSASAPAPAPDASAVPDGSTEGTADSEGSVTDPNNRFIDYPDGFTARIAKVERVPSAWGVNIAASDALIRVTVELENGGTVAVPLRDRAPQMTALYGPDRTEADPEAGYSGYPERVLQNELPRQVAPGSTVQFIRTFRVPVSDVGTLALWLSPKPDYYTEYTFTDLQTLLTAP